MKKLKSLRALGEDGLIRRIGRPFPTDTTVIKGIGDDCAVLKGPGSASFLLFASDMLVEGVHFTRTMPPEGIGWKSLAVNVSDIAAMGGIPRYAVVSVGLPRHLSVSFMDRLTHGLRRCARKFSVNLVGGDTNRSSHIVIDVAIIGEVNPKKVVYRSGARAGDSLFVTGRLGGSLDSGRHLCFIPRVREAATIVARGQKPHAMMDLSDGLLMDLTRLCRASHVSAQVNLSAVRRNSGCSIQDALTDGEDFELLMAVSAEDSDRFLAWGQKNLACGLSRIGRIISKKNRPVDFFDRQGQQVLTSLKGFQHF